MRYARGAVFWEAPMEMEAAPEPILALTIDSETMPIQDPDSDDEIWDKIWDELFNLPTEVSEELMMSLLE